VPKAKKELESSHLFLDGYFLRIRVWEVAEPVPPSEHRFKYFCFYGRPGERVVLYDNERGKGTTGITASMKRLTHSPISRR